MVSLCSAMMIGQANKVSTKKKKKKKGEEEVRFKPVCAPRIEREREGGGERERGREGASEGE